MNKTIGEMRRDVAERKQALVPDLIFNCKFSLSLDKNEEPCLYYITEQMADHISLCEDDLIAIEAWITGYRTFKKDRE